MTFREHHNWRKNPFLIVLAVIAGISLITGVLYLLVLVFMSLWNWLLPELFGLKTIVFWQAAGIMLLTAIFGRLLSHPAMGHRHGHHGPHHIRRLRRWTEEGDWSKEDWAGDEWNVKGGWKNWKYFDSWWKEEGKSLYETWLDKNKSGEEKSKE